MFGHDFYPTPPDVIEEMIFGEDLVDKNILEPSAGKGDIVDRLKQSTSQVIACEINKDLLQILSTKCSILANDFLTITPDQVSHLHYIVMNPPFSADEKHILHAWEIAPPGCRIISLCNHDILDNRYSRRRNQLYTIIQQNGWSNNLGNVFSSAERKTDVDVGIVKIQKPTASYDQEFSGFFLDDDPAEEQANALMPYNFVRSLVNRYVAAVKIFDQQLDTAVQLNQLIDVFHGDKLGFQCTKESYQTNRHQFKTDLQKSAWRYVFNQMNMEKYATRGVMNDINKFVEQQKKIPFTMKNIYHMLEIVIGTHESRIDQCIEEVFNKIAEHTDDNKYFVEGWKSNSHFLLPKMFVLPWITDNNYKWDLEQPYWKARYNGNRDLVDDMIKALCHITGRRYEDTRTLSRFVDDIKPHWGEWYCWGFFEIKGHKKGTCHFKFQNEDTWALFNKHVARIKGYPLFEPKAQTKYQNRNTGRSKTKN